MLKDIKNKTNGYILEFKIPFQEPGGKISLIKKWLAENYLIRLNVLDNNNITISPTESNPIKYEYDVSMADILLHATEEEIPLSQTILVNLLSSPNQTELFNPVNEYFESLKGQYKGPSQIDMLLDSLVLTRPQEKDRVRYLFRKWLVACVACSLGLKQNDMALGLVSAEAGIGKTSFFENITPEELRPFFQNVIRTSKKYNLGVLFSRNFLLNFDEFSAINANNEDEFKQLVSSSKLLMDGNKLKNNYYINRIANVCFTSNHTEAMGGFIRSVDKGMLRRLIVIEIDFIEDYRQALDVDQLWAEAVLMLHDGNYEWTKEDIDNNINYNYKYVMTSQAMRLLQLYYRVPQEGEKSEFMTANDILIDLRDHKKLTSQYNKVDRVTIGQAMSVLGYTRYAKRLKDVGVRYGYDVIRNYE